ncbi:MAG: hypothetical protein CL573_10445 [Alphaproteobacteria bacterium]|nr:hypothetical protein [Alphaproteobacteria bacterium]
MIARFISASVTILFLATPAWANEQRSEHFLISHAWSRATAPSQKVGAVFMTIATNGDKTDRLIGALSSAAESVQIHGHTTVNNVMRMRQVGGIDIPADGDITLAPGGLHIMLIGLKAPLLENTLVPLVLEFEKAGTLEIEAEVEAPGAKQASSRAPAKSTESHGSSSGHRGHKH